MRLNWLIAKYIFLFFLVDIPLIHSGLDHFSEIDSFEKWIIEQKFDFETNKVSCRASMKGNGTWFAQRIRLDKNDQILIPEGMKLKNTFRSSELEHVKSLLLKCRSSVLYLPN